MASSETKGEMGEILQYDIDCNLNKIKCSENNVSTKSPSRISLSYL